MGLSVIPGGKGGESDLAALVAETQREMAAAAEARPFRRDPYRAVLASQAKAIGVFGAATARWEKAVADVIAARDPLPPEARAELLRELVMATRQGAYDGMRKEAARMVRRLDAGLSMRIGFAIAGAYVAGALSVWAFVLLR